MELAQGWGLLALPPSRAGGDGTNEHNDMLNVVNSNSKGELQGQEGEYVRAGSTHSKRFSS